MKTNRTRIVHTPGHFQKHVENGFSNIFIYTENDTESDNRIINDSLLYKTHQQYTNIFKKSRCYEHFQQM